MDFLNLRDYAFLSQAAYRDLTALQRRALFSDLEARLTAGGQGVLSPANRFADPQAKMLTGSTTADPTDGYTFIDQRPNRPSGFSATAFQSNADGRIVLAVRGTEFDTDFVADVLDADFLGIVLAGKAKRQLIDAYRYYRQLSTAAGDRVIYTQQELAELARLGDSDVVADLGGGWVAPVDSGLGVMSSTSGLDLTGHSLGGHMAVLLADMIARNRGASLIGEVVTYNAPGMRGLLAEVPNLFGAGITFNSQISARTLNVIGQDGMNLTAGLAAMAGGRLIVDIEGEGTVSIANHSVFKLSDSLALHETVARLAPELTVTQIKALIDRAAAQESAGLERLLDALTATFGGSTRTTVGDRDAYYAHLSALQLSAPYQALLPVNGVAKVEYTPLVEGTNLAGSAKSDFADFLALTMLTPFALKASAGVAGAQAVLENIWRTAHAQDYLAWSNDQSARQAGDTNNDLNYTDKWYADRAGMLSQVLAAHELNTGGDRTLWTPSGLNTRFDDRQSGRSVDASPWQLTPAQNLRQVVFGSQDGETLSGNIRDDSLHGAGGDDTLRGGDGDDHLSGGADNDTLEGGKGRDMLYGGTGRDTLDGGAEIDELTGGGGDDTLNGGANDFARDVLNGGNGFDTYVIDGRSQWDRIVDADMSGEIKMAGVVLSGGKETSIGSRVWRSDDDRFAFWMVPSDFGEALAIRGPGSTAVYVPGWVDGQLGITLRPGDDNDEPDPDDPIPPEVDDRVRDGQRWAPRADPLVFDLDGDGIESSGLNAANPILFDNNADGVLNPTGWIRADDGFLVLDRNGNGAIDNGRELFGDATPLNGNGSMDLGAGIAANGFAALDREDTNRDGRVDAADARWASLRVWRDANQDGVSQAGELATLASLDITGIATQATVVNQNLGNGNVLLQAGTFTRSDSSTGTSGTVQEISELNFAEDTFRRRFSDSIPVLAEVRTLPNMRASGRVRDLHEAASLVSPEGAALRAALSAYAGAASASAQGQQIEGLIATWAQTSDMGTTAERLANMQQGGKQYALNVLRIGSVNRPAENAPEWAAWQALESQTLARLDVLGAFAGRHFFDLEGFVQATPRTNGALMGLSMTAAQRANNNDPAFSGTITIDLALAPEQKLSLDQALEALTGGVFEALLFQTRGRGFGEKVVTSLTEQGIVHDFSAVYQEFDTRIAVNPIDALYDIAAFNLATATAYSGTSFEGWSRLQTLARSVAATPDGAAALSRLNIVLDPVGSVVSTLGSRSLVAFGGAADTRFVGGSDIDYTEGGAGRDTLEGNGSDDHLMGGDGDDLLRGGDGIDELAGGGGDDTLYGDAGDDNLAGDSGNDQLVGGEGHDDLSGGVGNDTMSGGAGADLLVGNEGADSLDGGDGDDQLDAGEGDDTLQGGAGIDTLAGGDGNDRLEGGAGEDVLLGQAGDDVLTDTEGDNYFDGGAGNDQMFGGVGEDVFIYGRGYGNDRVTTGGAGSSGRADRIRLTDLTRRDVTFYLQGPYSNVPDWALDDTRNGPKRLIIEINDTKEQLEIALHRDLAKGMELIEFADGVVLSASQVLVEGAIVDGTDGSRFDWDRTMGNDRFVLQPGASFVEFGGGRDRLELSLGIGEVTARSALFRESNHTHELAFGAGIAPADVLPSLVDIGDRKYLKLAFSATDAVQLPWNGGWRENLSLNLSFADGTRQTLASLVDQRAFPSDSFTGSNGDETFVDQLGNDSFAGGAGTDTIQLRLGDNTVDGGAGNDYIEDGLGDDTYLFSIGMGADQVALPKLAASGGNVVRMAHGISPADIQVSRSEEFLQLRHANGIDSIAFVGDAYYARELTAETAVGLHRVEFADGTVWRLADLQELASTATAGDDQLSGTEHADVLRGGSGDDWLRLTGRPNDAGGDVVDGGNGDDRIEVYADGPGYAVHVSGGAGNDDLRVTQRAGIVTLDPGAGNESFGFADAVFFDRGYGKDSLLLGLQIKPITIVLGSTIAPDDIEVTKDVHQGLSVILRIKGTDDTLRLQSTAPAGVIAFADGTTWRLAQLHERALVAATEYADVVVGTSSGDSISAGAGNDTVLGRAGDDVIDAGAGDDAVHGGEGNDTYVFRRGSGKDVYDVRFGDPASVGKTLNDTDTVDIVGNREEVVLQSRLGDLVVRFTDTADEFTVRGFAYTDPAESAIILRFADGTTMDSSSILAELSLDPNLTGGTFGDDVFAASAASQTLYGGAGNDLLDGGAGTDWLDGQFGDDTYVFGYGYGNDRIFEGIPYGNGVDQGLDTIRFAEGVLPSDVTLSLDSTANELVFALAGGNDTLRVANQHGGRIERAVFSDGTVWELAGMGGGNYTGTSGADRIVATIQNDRVSGGEGNDQIFGRAGDDVLEGGAGDDLVDGGQGSDLLMGGDGNDRLTQGLGWLEGAEPSPDMAGAFGTERDILDGGAGDDELHVNPGTTIRFGRGGGTDTVLGGGARVELMAGIAPSEIQLYTVAEADGASTVVLAISGTEDQIRFGNDFGPVPYGGYGPISEVIFSDGTRWDVDAVLSRLAQYSTPGADRMYAAPSGSTLSGGGGDDWILGGNGNDTLLGGDGADFILGGKGADVLDGGADGWVPSNSAGPRDILDGGDGADTYRFGRGYGWDVVTVGRMNPETVDGMATDRILLGAGIAPRDVAVMHEQTHDYGGSIELIIADTNDRLTLSGGVNARNYVIEFADGTRWLPTDVLRFLGNSRERSGAIDGTSDSERIIGSDLADQISGHEGDDVLSGGRGTDQLNGGEGADDLDGGAGDDLLVGGLGDDTYRFGRGYGRDVVVDFDRSTGHDRVLLNGDVDAEDISVSRDDSNIRLRIENTTDELVLRWYPHDNYRIESVEFADGIVWSAQTLEQMAAASITVSGTTGSDDLTGTRGPDILSGGAGDDQLRGLAGDDTLIGGLGNDHLEGGPGADELVGGSGDDTYVVDALDSVREESGEGTDSVRSTDSITLQEFFENGALDGVASASITGNELNNVLQGNVGSNTLLGGAGNDQMSGGGGNDTLDGGSGDDTLDGELGDDVLIGGEGSDLFRMSSTSGFDTIRPDSGGDDSAVDAIAFDATVTPDRVVLSRLDALTLAVTVSGGPTIRAEGFSYTRGNTNSSVDEIRFSDGTVWAHAELVDRASTITGTPGNDTLYANASLSTTLRGLAGNDTLWGGSAADEIDGGAGADLMIGGGGNDAYIVDNAGDVVSETEAASGGIDSVRSSIDWSLPDSVENLELTGAASINGTGTSRSNVLLGNIGNNILNGRGGEDTISGGRGDDTLVAAGQGARFEFARGDGVDTIENWSENGIGTAAGTLAFGSDIAASNLRLARVEGTDDLVVDIDGTSDRLVVKYHFSLSGAMRPGGLSSIAFVDGTTWDRTAIDAQAGAILPPPPPPPPVGGQTLVGTAGNDWLVGGSGGDLIFGLDGNDNLNGEGGSDVLDGGNGDDYMVGGLGDDQLLGGSGQDMMLGGVGNDVLDGGTPGLYADYLQGGGGSDRLISDGSGATFSYARGDGNDVIENRAPSGAASGTLNFLGSDLNASDLSLVRGVDVQADDLLITVVPTGHTITVKDHFARNGDLRTGGLSGLWFSDNSYWSRAEIDRNTQGAREYATYWDDVLQGTPGNDWIQAFSGNDVVYGNAGEDQLYGDEGDDSLYGGDGGDSLTGGSGDDMLDGGTAGTYADYLSGGTGNDHLISDGSSATFSYARGDGDDLIENRAAIGTASGTLSFLGSDLNVADLSLVRGVDEQANDLLITVVSTGHTITVKDHFARDGDLRSGGLSAIWFADNSYWSRTEIDRNTQGTRDFPSNWDDTLQGTPGNDWIQAFSGDDVVYGAEGDDQLNGDDGNDVLFGDAGTDSLNGGSGDDTLDSGASGVYADYLIGGLGDDRLISHGGGATFSYAAGDGNDIIENRAAAGDANGVLNFLGSSINAVDLSLARGSGLEGNDLLITVNTTGHTIKVRDHFLRSGSERRGGLSGIWFSDNSYWGRQDIDVNTIGAGGTATEGNDVLNGFGDNDTISGLGGDDVIYGDYGDDTLNGNAGNDQLFGEFGSDRLDGGSGQDQMAGGADDDVYVVDDMGDTVIESAGEGTDTVESSITYSLGVEVENLTLIGSAAINGSGNALSNTLTGNDADNVLDGGAGADYLAGGLGNDIYVVDQASDVVSEAAGAGTDTVRSTVSYTLGANVENLELLGVAAINGTGNTLANTLVGNSANNTLNGGSGADALRGGGGNDTYVVDNVGDVVIETAGEGTDLVQSSVSYTLSADVENLTLTGTGGINATGNALANVLTGNSGANRLDGGAGADTMAGGTGNDVYVVDNAGDVVTEAVSAGTDRVEASISYTLGVNVENLTLTGTANIDGTGNSAVNTINGNAGNNRINGGAGADTMAGGAGDDTYVVDNTADVVTEAASAGSDLVESSVTFTLGNNVENLTLTGTSAINGTGNTLANYLKGNSGANTLNGGSGNDVLQGGAGNDALTDTSGRGVFDGGDGTDTLTGGTDRQFFAGGLGADTHTLGGGADIIAFNRGHGADTVIAPASGTGQGETNDTLSLAGIRYSELRLARSGTDLLVKVAGTTDSVRVAGWYAAAGNKTVSTLQMVVDSTADYDAGSADALLNRRVVRLNFGSIVSAFDTAYAANPSIGDWAVPTATLAAARTVSSDTDAIGGQLAYRYGRDGNLAGVDFATAQAVIGDTGFATSAQSIGTGATSGGVRLMNVTVDSSASETPQGDVRVTNGVTGQPLRMRAFLEEQLRYALAPDGVDAVLVEPASQTVDASPTGSPSLLWQAKDNLPSSVSDPSVVLPGEFPRAIPLDDIAVGIDETPVEICDEAGEQDAAGAAPSSSAMPGLKTATVADTLDTLAQSIVRTQPAVRAITPVSEDGMIASVTMSEEQVRHGLPAAGSQRTLEPLTAPLSSVESVVHVQPVGRGAVEPADGPTPLTHNEAVRIQPAHDGWFTRSKFGFLKRAQIISATQEADAPAAIESAAEAIVEVPDSLDVTPATDFSAVRNWLIKASGSTAEDRWAELNIGIERHVAVDRGALLGGEVAAETPAPVPAALVVSREDRLGFSAGRHGAMLR